MKLRVLCAGVVLAVALSGCSSTSITRNFTYTDTGVNKPAEFPVLRARGYSVISTQPGRTCAEREIQAMRASKMEAYRELNEQVNGMYIKTRTTLNNTRQNVDAVQTEVEGFLKGARVIRQFPLDNTYVTEVELDTRVLYDMYLMRGAF